MVLIVAVSALFVLAVPQIAHAQGLGYVDDNVLESDGESIPLGWAMFGEPFTEAGMSWPVELANDANTEQCVRPSVPSTPTDACDPSMNDMTDKIAVVTRGCCFFTTKLTNVFNANAKAMVVINDREDAVQAPYWQLVLGPTPGWPNLIRIPVGMISHDDGDRLLTWGGYVTARKIRVGEHQAALDGSVVNFRTMYSEFQLNSLRNWVISFWRFPDVVKASHRQSLLNKLWSADEQFAKGNINAVIAKMEDIITQVGELEAKGQFDPAFAEAVIADAQSVIDGLGL